MVTSHNVNREWIQWKTKSKNDHKMNMATNRLRISIEIIVNIIRRTTLILKFDSKDSFLAIIIKKISIKNKSHRH